MNRVEKLLRTYLHHWYPGGITNDEIVRPVLLDLATHGDENEVHLVHSLLPNEALASLLKLLADVRNEAYSCEIHLIGPGSEVLDSGKLRRIHEVLLKLERGEGCGIGS